jgi:endo-1,3(4)-beta-glucanase
MAQLAHIAHEIGDMDSYEKALGTVHDSLVLQLFERNDRLLYDTDFGGVVSAACFQDPKADFGNGRYNDHHFHYSYIIYASAILGRFNSTFLHRYGKYIDALVFDVASSIDHVSSSPNIVAAYPLARHKSFYDGHSWASGLFPQANGKSQESSSEAVNCYFAVTLWSRLKEDLVLYNFSRLLLAMEIRSAQKYWHITPECPFASQPPFSTNNFMVGNLGGLDVTATTWFGSKPFYVHLINLLPITSITEE